MLAFMPFQALLWFSTCKTSSLGGLSPLMSYLRRLERVWEDDPWLLPPPAPKLPVLPDPPPAPVDPADCLFPPRSFSTAARFPVRAASSSSCSFPISTQTERTHSPGTRTASTRLPKHQNIPQIPPRSFLSFSIPSPDRETSLPPCRDHAPPVFHKSPPLTPYPRLLTPSANHKSERLGIKRPLANHTARNTVTAPDWPKGRTERLLTPITA